MRQPKRPEILHVLEQNASLVYVQRTDAPGPIACLNVEMVPPVQTGHQTLVHRCLTPRPSVAQAASASRD